MPRQTFQESAAWKAGWKSLRKGVSTLDVLVAAVLVIAMLALASKAVSSRASTAAFYDKTSMLEEKAILLSERLLKTCSGLASCANNYSKSYVLDDKPITLNNSGVAVINLQGRELFSKGVAAGFCVNRLAAYQGEAVVMRSCVNG